MIFAQKRVSPVLTKSFCNQKPEDNFCQVFVQFIKRNSTCPTKISTIATGVILLNCCEDPPPKNTFVEQIQIENSIQSKEHQKFNLLTSFNFSYQFTGIRLYYKISPIAHDLCPEIGHPLPKIYIESETRFIQKDIKKICILHTFNFFYFNSFDKVINYPQFYMTFAQKRTFNPKNIL